MNLRHSLPATLVLALCVALPARAQRVSLADRVTVLEQYVANSQANTDLLNQIDQLRREVVELRGVAEQLQYENRQLRQQADSQFQALEKRIGQLENNAVPPAVGAEGGVPVAARGGAAVDAGPAAAVHGDAGALAAAADEGVAYQKALDLLKAGNYVESSRLFVAFLDTWPNGVYTPNALYWLGESYYVTGNYPLAAEQFRAVMGRYPTHDKAAGALLKLGLCEYNEGRLDQAETLLAEVGVRYPDTAVATVAADRLRSIRANR